MSNNCNRFLRPRTRREMLRDCANGFGALALTALFGEEEARAAGAGAANPLAPKSPMFPVKAKRVIFLFMHGGPSQVDTFDPKPLLTRDNGKPYSGRAKPRVVFAQTGNLLKSPWEFKKYGQSGIEVSDLFPEVGKCVDDMCMRAFAPCTPTIPRTAGRCLQLHTGSDTFVRPSMGSWLTYGLGNGKSESARIHHHLPDARTRRGAELVIGLPARRLSGDAHRERGNPGGKSGD